MTQRPSRWGFIFLTIFMVALAAAAFFAWQLRITESPQPAGLLAADKGYGVTIDLTRYDDETLTATLDDLDQKGLTWLRQPVLWAEIEQTQGQLDWAALDRTVGQVANLSPRTKLIAVLYTSPAWARPAETPATTPPTEISDFGSFVRAFAARYGEQVDYYQIWHEPNLSANWGNAFVDPDAYANLLREAALNIHAVDPEAYLLTAALAPTLENGPLNLNELAYLDQLYQARADGWFDIVAVQPYGFDSEPTDPARPDTLNFSRAELVRQVMLDHGAAETPLWATAFGWNVLPEDWAGPAAPWHSDTPQKQAQRTAAAIEQARRDWPWLGPMLAIRWDSSGLAPDDPARGFALAETPPILEAIQSAAARQDVATAGRYPANHASGVYSSGWRFALTRADIPRQEPGTLAISFEGTGLDLTVNRGPFRGYLWITIDGQPANALPQDGSGRSYVVLYDPLRGSETVTLAQNLAPGRHQAIIEAEGGWGQWAVSGWTVRNDVGGNAAQTGLALAGIVAVFSGVALLGQLLHASLDILQRVWAWAEIGVALYGAMLREPGQMIVTFILAIGFYLAPGFLALVLLPLLVLAILCRPDLGLAVIALSLSFFQASKRLPIGSFSPVELALALTVIGFIFRGLLALGRAAYATESFAASRATGDRRPPALGPEGVGVTGDRQSKISNLQPATHEPQSITPEVPTPQPQSAIRNPKSAIPNPQSIDFAALMLVVLALLATFAAENFGVSLREWRVVVFESILFYFLVRLGCDFNPQAAPRPSSPAWAWRLVDAFVAGATLQAAIALYLYFFTDQSITAEGVRRALGLAYGSPNNLSLFLDRVWPLLLAVTVLPGVKVRRWWYGAGLVVVSLALYLTFSKGALFLGLPASLVAMAIFYTLRHQGRNRRWVIAAATGGIAIILLAVIPLSQTARFQTTFDFKQGSTGFFRLKLWQASLAMLRDHWPLGVGLDNFLYQYRTRYILPEAWQEPNLSHPHNLILDFGTRLGLGGIVILLWLQAAFWRSAWQLYQRSPSPLILGLMGSMIAFLSHGLVDNSYFLVDLAFAFFLTTGLIQRLAEQSTRES